MGVDQVRSQGAKEEFFLLYSKKWLNICKAKTDAITLYRYTIFSIKIL